eukprot:363004-Chlamydomonas_euryale.AAC.2
MGIWHAYRQAACAKVSRFKTGWPRHKAVHPVDYPDTMLSPRSAHETPTLNHMKYDRSPEDSAFSDHTHVSKSHSLGYSILTVHQSHQASKQASRQSDAHCNHTILVGWA